MSGGFCAQYAFYLDIFRNSFGAPPCGAQYEASLSAVSFCSVGVGADIVCLTKIYCMGTDLPVHRRFVPIGKGRCSGGMREGRDDAAEEWEGDDAAEEWEGTMRRRNGKGTMQRRNGEGKRRCSGGMRKGRDEETRISMKDQNGYFTVEAALVFPVALGTVLFVVYMMLFQYDRCLLEQDLGALALWGSQAEAESEAELKTLLQKRTADMYWDKYAVWEMNTLDVRLEKNRISVTGEGQLTFPVPGINFWNRDNVWEAEAAYSFWRISPVDFVRLCNRAKTWQGTEDRQEAEDENGG